MTELSGKTALVTGASAPTGIGRAVALRLAEQGATVVVTDVGGEVELAGERVTRRALLEQLVATVEADGGQAVADLLDVTDAGAIARCLASIERDHGGVDILVNNAGSLAGSDWFLDTTPEEWQMSFAVNLLGPMRLAQAVIPGMQRAGGGRIINIGSTGSLGAEPGFGAYTAMKHALVGLSKTLAAEFGRDGILCNTVCPGFIATDMHLAANARLAAEAGESLAETRARRYAGVALGDAGRPEDVADAVAFLAGPAARYITGTNLPVTGGVPVGI